MCFDNDGYPELTNDRVCKARKPHKCSECRGVIAKGEHYHRHSGKFDGGFFDDKVCRRCDYDRVRVVEHELAEGCHWNEAWPPSGGLVEHLEESGLGQTRNEDVPEPFKVGDLPKRPAVLTGARS
jgi:ribosomal protein L40E